MGVGLFFKPHAPVLDLFHSFILERTHWEHARMEKSWRNACWAFIRSSYCYIVHHTRVANCKVPFKKKKTQKTSHPHPSSSSHLFSIHDGCLPVAFLRAAYSLQQVVVILFENADSKLHFLNHRHSLGSRAHWRYIDRPAFCIKTAWNRMRLFLLRVWMCTCSTFLPLMASVKCFLGL